MAAGESDFLVQAATYLGAAAIAVPVFNRLKLGSILGYLAAGVAVGPFGLNLLHQEEGVFHIAELGVVLFLFVIGLELSLSRLWSMRSQIFGLGAAQMIVTGGGDRRLFARILVDGLCASMAERPARAQHTLWRAVILDSPVSGSGGYPAPRRRADYRRGRR